MADVTYAELQTLVAEKLGLLTDSESLPADYAALIQKNCTSVQAQLELFDIVSFAVQSGLDEAYADVFADLVAAQCAAPFQIAEPERSKLESNRLGMPGYSVAERRIRAMFITPKQYTKSDVAVV